MGKKVPYEENHRINDKGVLEKKCNKHNIYFPEENEWFPCNNEYFYINTSNKTDGLHPECIRCGVAKGTKWQKDNPEQYKANNKRNNKINADAHKEYVREYLRKWREAGKDKEYYKNNPFKFSEYNKTRREKNHNINKQEWQECLKYFDYQCAYCGMSLKEHKKQFKEQLHKEHVILDGKDNISNCVPSCKTCNSSKHESSLNDWYNDNNISYTYERYHKIYMWMRYDYKKYIMPKRRRKRQKLNTVLKEIEQRKNKRK